MQGLEENNQPTNKGKNGLVVPLALVGILLAGSVGYNIYQANQIGNLEKNESLNSQILKNETKQEVLYTEIQKFIREVEHCNYQAHLFFLINLIKAFVF